MQDMDKDTDKTITESVDSFIDGYLDDCTRKIQAIAHDMQSIAKYRNIMLEKIKRVYYAIHDTAPYKADHARLKEPIHYYIVPEHDGKSFLNKEEVEILSRLMNIRLSLSSKNGEEILIIGNPVLIF